MKPSKIFKITFAFFFLGFMGLTFVSWPQMNLNSNLQAVVSLPEDLHPDYAPEVKIDTNKKGAEVTYANVMLQYMAGGLLYLAGPVAILIIAVAGLRYVTSHGDQNMMDGAKKTLTYAVIGLVVIILSFAIIRAIISVLVSTG